MDAEFHGDRLTMMDELELSDLAVREAAIDEEETMFNPDEHPKAPHPKEEGITDHDGANEVDLMIDSQPIELELGLEDADIDVV